MLSPEGGWVSVHPQCHPAVPDRPCLVLVGAPGLKKRQYKY